jgi:HEAT repeat protein
VPEPIPLQNPPISPPQRFTFKIAPDTPLKDLLPVPPKVQKTARPVLPQDLAHVPEVEFQTPLAKDLSNEEAMKRTAHMLAKINHLNGKKTDGFVEALRGERPDLIGLPFAMGDACRIKGERSRQFTQAVATVRRCLQPSPPLMPQPIPTPSASSPAPSQPTPPPAVGGAQPTSAAVAADVLQLQVPVGTVAFREVDDRNREAFWDQYQAACAQEDKALSRTDRPHLEAVTLARIAALMQVLAPEPPDVRLGLVKYLSGVSHVEATRALARLSLFSAEDEVRHAAVDALKVRRERDYTDVLLQGLRYPWPAVARRAADALVKLERTDVLPQIVGVLDEPDPRIPVLKEVNGKKVPVVRELVRVNHHRNCMLCHAPGNTPAVSPETLTAAVPVPNEPLPSPSQGYRNALPDILVRIDVTYLRQDFSMFQPVADANPWPEMQRFDFLVRTREVTDAEADAYREKLDKREPGRLSPYHRAALTALRELTGKDTEPTAAAWRRLLELPARPS